MYSINKISEKLGLSVSSDSQIQISEIVTDSRKIYFPEQSIFFALVGTTKSGENFVQDAYKKGVRAFVVNKNFDSQNFPDSVFFKVENVLESLQTLAKWHRSQFHIPIIGVTGSNGKTIIKELLFQLLHSTYNIARSPKSYNSQLGVPLSVWQLSPQNNLGIFEAGISKPGEMQKLQEIINPNIGIYTFAGDAHADEFASSIEKIQEKLKLFLETDILFYSADEEILHEQIINFKEEKNHAIKLFAWSRNEGEILWVNNIEKLEAETALTCTYNAEKFSFFIPFTDDASINNCILCASILLHFGFTTISITKSMTQLKPVEMRLQLIKGSNNCSIINDSYNFDINSFRIALDFLEQQQQHKNKTVILSDINQNIADDKSLYQKIAGMLNQKNIYRFIGIGKQLQNYKQLFSDIGNTVFFETTLDFLNAIKSLKFENETILVKGARIYEFEKISAYLEQQSHQTVLEINLDAIRHNIQAYRKELLPNVKIMAMVKAFSYGSGSFEIANLLQHAGVDYLAVAYADEGVSLRNAGIDLPIMVLNIDESSFENIVNYRLEPELFSQKIFTAFKHFLNQRGLEKFPVHIKLDTGMHRLGFMEADIPHICKQLSLDNVFKIASAFTHLVASDDENEDEFTLHQAKLFSEMSMQIENAVNYKFINHIANTSAIERFPNIQMDMVRLGIGMYGVDGNKNMQAKLQTVTTLKSTIAQIKNVKKGESVGYGRKSKLDRDSIIATIRIGYADGYIRAFGNGVGKIFINGKLANIVGNVCMDMTMIDITNIDAEEEDEVIIFGKELSVQLLAKWGNTIPYEIFTNISQRVRRVYFQE